MGRSALDAIAAMLALGSGGFEREEVRAFVEEERQHRRDRRRGRRASESYSDVILRLVELETNVKVRSVSPSAYRRFNLPQPSRLADRPDKASPPTA